MSQAFIQCSLGAHWSQILLQTETLLDIRTLSLAVSVPCSRGLQRERGGTISIYRTHFFTRFSNHWASCFDSIQLKSVIFALYGTISLPRARKVIQLTVYTCWPRPGGPSNLASPAGAAGRLPSDGPSGNAAVSVEHHYLAGSHCQLACRTEQGGTKYITLA